MSAIRSPLLSVRASGPLACFTRPELKTERVSYEVPTPSAVRGLLEAIFWKPGLRWHIRRIHLLSPIRFVSFKRNEVRTIASRPADAVVRDGGEIKHYFADDDRAQRHTLALRDVDYLFESYMTLTERAGPGDNMTKFVDMFERRVAKGQHFHQPYFGCREFVADVSPANGAPPPIEESKDLGIMLWDLEFGKVNRPRFFKAQLDRGVVDVPDDPEATLVELARETAP